MVFMCQSLSSSSSHPFPCPLCVRLSPFSLCLCLCFCFANKIIYAICLDSMYMHPRMIFIFLFLIYFTLYGNLYVHLCLWKWSLLFLWNSRLSSFSLQGLCPCLECYIPSHLYSLPLNVCSFFRSQFRDSHPDNLFLISQSGLAASTTCLENIL